MPKEISVKVIADSISPTDHRLTTLECTFPRFILAEVNTHRVFSRNSASSRAIPLAKQIHSVSDDPFVPKVFMKNKPGMQAGEIFSEEDQKLCRYAWTKGLEGALQSARMMEQLGVHKQWASRLLEPFMWHTAIISATEWDGFFQQRLSRHGMAQPEFGELADCIEAAMAESTPSLLNYGQWHLPYTRPEERASMSLTDLIKLCVARSARVSYLNHDGQLSLEDDFKLFQRLIAGKHTSPFEHAATPDALRNANFNGWGQFRWYLENGVEPWFWEGEWNAGIKD